MSNYFCITLLENNRILLRRIVQNILWLLGKISIRSFSYGAIHKLRRQDFTNFWPPSPLRRQVYYISLYSKIGIWLIPPPPSPAYVVYGWSLCRTLLLRNSLWTLQWFYVMFYTLRKFFLSSFFLLKKPSQFFIPPRK